MRALDLNISQTNAKFSQLALQLAKNLTECWIKCIFFELADMKFYKTLGMVWTGVALAFASAPAVADDMDVLGQFLEQNFPVQNDPMEAFALSHAGQVEA